MVDRTVPIWWKKPHQVCFYGSVLESRLHPLGGMSRREKTEQRMRETEDHAQASSHKAPLGEGSLTEERTPIAQEPRTGLPCPQAEEVSKRVWHPKEFDLDWPDGWHRGIAVKCRAHESRKCARCARERIAGPGLLWLGGPCA
jgi:hypothetical protein